MRTLEDQHRLLDELLLSMARQRKSAGETEWMEFKTNIGESHRSITYEGVGNYISGLANSACLKYKSHGQLRRPLSNEEIAYLRKRKLVEGRKNALYFAKSVAKATGQKAEYTRNKGFDDNYYKDLIIKALEQHGKMTRPEINDLLLSKLPDALTEQQKLSKIGNLLTTLRKGGRIVSGKNKKWMLK